MVPLWLIVTDIGNSPSLDTGPPIIVRFEGFSGSMVNIDSVLEPGCKANVII